MLERLVDDLGRLPAQGVPQPDAILVTGDIAFSGNVRVRSSDTESREYALAGDWLRAAGAAIRLGPSRIFLVPGNHDVQRNADRHRPTSRLVKALHRGEESLDEALADPADRALLVSRLAHYLAFSMDFAPACLAPPESPDKHLFWQYRLEAREGLFIRLIGLNTSLLCADDADRGRLRLGKAILAQAFASSQRREGELVLVLGHHPLQGGWLADEYEVNAWIQNHAHIHVSGHVHDPGSEESRTGWGASLVRIASGAMHEESRPPGVPQGHGYNVASVLVDEAARLHLRVWPRSWSEKKKHFQASGEGVLEGQRYAQHPLGLSAPRPAPPAPVPPTAPPLRRASDVASMLFEGPGGVPALAVPHFQGRARELATLREALSSDTIPCVVVTGAPGIGKSSLVRQFVATEARSVFSEVAWLDAGRLPSELSRVAVRFGWKAGERLPIVGEANHHLAHTMHERPVLLVIDNVNPQHVDPRDIPVPGGRCRTLVTTQAALLHEDLDKPARALTLGLWNNETCRTYLRTVAPTVTAVPDAELDSLAHFVRYLPLALRLLARLLLSPGATPARVLARLRSEPLGTLDSAARGGERGIAATLLASYEELDSTQRRILCALAACATATREPVIAAVASLPEGIVAQSLAELAQRSLVDYDAHAARPWGMHDVVRLFVRRQSGALEADPAHLGFVRAHLGAHTDPKHWRALDSEMPEVWWALEKLLATHAEGAQELLSLTREHLVRRGKYGELIDAYTRLLHLLPPDSTSLAEVQGDLGQCYRRLGDLHRAIDFNERSLLLSQRLGHLQSQANALGNLGLCYRRMGNLPKAIEYNLQALVLEEGLRRFDQQASALGNLGLCYRSLGDPAQALEYHQRALKLDEQLGRLEGQANALTNIGLCYGLMGRPELALEHHQRAFAIDEGLGRLHGQATSLGNQGLCYRMMGDLEKAIAHHRQALEMDEKLGRYEGQANHLSNLGDCYQELGQSAEAERDFQRALKCYRMMGLGDDHPSIQRVAAAVQKAVEQQRLVSSRS